VLTPDMVQPQLYGEVIEPNMDPGACLLFAHGFNVHFGQISPREDSTWCWSRPRARARWCAASTRSAAACRRMYAVYQDKSGNAEQLALAYAPASAARAPDIIKTTFKEETETDLFGEQAVLCGGATAGAGRLRNPGRSRLPARNRLLRMCCTS
jgi:ketol-acid reductoisomerase